MPDVGKQRPHEDRRGDTGDMAADMVIIQRAGADSHHRPGRRYPPGGLRSLTARDVVVRQGGVGRLVLAREFHGDGVRVLMAPRAALAFGAGLGLALALVAGLRRQHRAWRRERVNAGMRPA